MLLATAAARAWHVHRLDVKTASLNAPVDVEIYIVIYGFEDAGKIALLLKAMYRAKQAGHLWAEFLRETLKDEGASQSDPDKCVFIIIVDGCLIIILVYVDDMLIVGKV